jgi:hypothetical protein
MRDKRGKATIGSPVVVAGGEGCQVEGSEACKARQLLHLPLKCCAAAKHTGPSERPSGFQPEFSKYKVIIYSKTEHAAAKCLWAGVCTVGAEDLKTTCSHGAEGMRGMAWATQLDGPTGVDEKEGVLPGWPVCILALVSGTHHCQFVDGQHKAQGGPEFSL